MKARIVPEGNFFVGQVYGTWQNLLFGTERVGWDTVTDRCFTRLGARLELEAWKRKHYIKEFNL